MKKNLIHIVHLSPYWLRWLTVQDDAQGLIAKDCGEIAGESAKILDEWTKGRSDSPGEIYLYDGRSIYFAFQLKLPQKAAGEAAGAIQLKIRQELGLPLEAVAWTTWREKGATDKQTVFSTIVARREALHDLKSWSARQTIGPVWIGADISAVSSLAAELDQSSPLVVLNSDASRVLMYFARQGNFVARNALSFANGHGHLNLSGINFQESRQLDFSRQGREKLKETFPQLAAVPTLALPDFSAQKKYRRLRPLAADHLNFDPVLLGGLLQIHSGQPPMDSLLREPGGRSFLQVLIQNTRIRFPLLACVCIALLLVISLWGVRQQRVRARTFLNEHAAELVQPTLILNGQTQILQQVRTERAKALTPALMAIHQSAPDGIQLESLLISSGGQMKLQGSTPKIETANAYFKALAENAVFSPGSVQLLEIRQIKDKVSFQIAAQVRTRAKS